MGNYGSFTINGSSSSGEEFGYRVSSIGDINGDGIDDVAVTARRGQGGSYSEASLGAVYVIYGHDGPDLEFSLDDLDGSNGFKIEADPGISDYSYSTTFGSNIAGLGDVDGDGVDDFAIVQNGTGYSYSEVGGGVSQGVAYVVYGGQTVESDAVAVTDLDHARLDAEGEIRDVVALGDVNGDGLNDIGLNVNTAVETQYANRTYYYDANENGVPEAEEYSYSYSQRVRVESVGGYVVFGVEDGFTDETEIADRGNSDVVNSIEDLDGSDGFVVDAGQTASLGGFYGEYSEGPRLAQSSVGIGGDSAGDTSGVGLQGGGDINGDGFSDVLVNRGEVSVEDSVFIRSPDGSLNDYSYGGVIEGVTERGAIDGAALDGSAEETTDITFSGDIYGVETQPRIIGDISGGDGAEELGFLGTGVGDEISEAGLTTANGVFVLNGNSDLFAASPDALNVADLGEGEAFYFSSFNFSEYDGFQSFNISGLFDAGDVNGDGIDDLAIVGTFQSETNYEAGGYFVLGSSEAQSGVFNLDEMVGDGTAYLFRTNSGFSGEPTVITSAGDFNNDGATDLMWGARDADDRDGETYILFGGAALEAIDGVDGSDDNVLSLENAEVDVDTNELPIRVFLTGSQVYQDEGDDGATAFTFTLTRNGDLSTEVSIDFQVQGGADQYSYYEDADAADFVGGVLPSGTVTFAEGEDTATVTVEVAGDTSNEEDEAFTVQLSNGVAANDTVVVLEDEQATGVINNDDYPVEFYTYNASVTEGNPGDDVELSFNVYRSGNIDVAASVDYALSPYAFGGSSSADDFEDGLPQSGTVHFAAGETHQVVTFAIAEDQVDESTEYATFTLSNAQAEDGSETEITRDLSYGYIYDDDDPVTLRVNNTSVTEGNPGDDTTLDFIIYRSGNTTVEATVEYVMTPSTYSPANGDDFEGGLPQSGSVVFAPGETSRTVSFAIEEDFEIESNEYVTLTLGNVLVEDGVDVNISRGTASGYIYNDDTPVTFSSSYVDVTETDDVNVTLTFTVTRTGPTDVAASVDFALEGDGVSPEDFASGFIDPDTGEPRSGTLEFAAGETTRTISMEVAPDDEFEGSEYVRLLLTNATSEDVNAAVINTPSVYGYIYDDDEPSYIYANDSYMTEGDPGEDRVMTFTISRYGSTDFEASVAYEIGAYDGSNAADADDFVSGFPASGRVTFAAGETSQTISVVISGDNDVEPEEYLQLTLSDPQGPDGELVEITDANAFGRIGNDDFPMRFAVYDVNQDEGDSGETTDMVFRIHRSGDTSVAGSVDYSVEAYPSSQEADADDFASSFPMSGTVEFAAGETFQDVTVQIQGDDDIESNEFFRMVLSNPAAEDGGDVELTSASAFGTIRNDDAPAQFSVSYAAATEGSNGTGTTTPLTFTVYRSGDTESEASVDYNVGGYISPASSAEASDFDGGFPSSGTLTFAAGETSRTVTLQVVDDEAYEGTEYVSFELSNAQGSGVNGASISSGSAIGYIYDDETPTYFRIYNASTTEGEEGETSTMLFQVQRSGNVAEAGTVDYEITEYRYGSSATSADFVEGLPQSGTVSFAAGQSTQWISVDVAGDNISETTEYFEVNLSNATSDDPNGRPILSDSQAYGYIYDDDLPVYFRVRGSVVTEGDGADANVLTFQITRDGDTSVAATVDYNVAGGTAGADDFDSAFPTSGTLSFAAGETSKTVSLVVNADDLVEGDEYTYLTLSNADTDADGVTAHIARGSAHATIRDDDFQANISVSSSSYVYEGDEGDDRALTFTVYRSGDLTSTVTMEYDFAADGYAPVDADDFEDGLPQNGVLTFNPGETSRTVSIRIAEDDEIEGNERGTFSIRNVVSDGAHGVNVQRASAVGVIYNDDRAPEIRVTANGSLWGTSVNEGNSGVTPVDITFTRDGDSSGAATVTYDLITQNNVRWANSADIEGDLPSTGNTVEFADGEDSVTVTINVIGDTTIEANENFQIQITDIESDVDYALYNSSLNVSIRNDDGRPPLPELPFDVDGDGVIEPGEFIRVEADVFGDPHIVTLDGLGYDFQAVGEYVLVETEEGAENPFSVQVRFEAFPGSDLVSVTTRMAVEVNGVTVEIDALGDDTLLIDGVAPDADALALGAIDIDGDGTQEVFISEDGKYSIVLNDANEQLMVGLTDNALNVCVFLASPDDGGNAGSVRGLMGNANQDLSDDFGLRNGDDIPDEVISFDSDGVPSLTFDYLYGRGEFEDGGYRASWALAEGEALFSGETPAYPENFPAGPLTLEGIPDDIREAAEQAARDAGLSPEDNEVIFNNAVLDFALTGMGAFLAGATQLAAEPEQATEASEAPENVQSVSVAASQAEITEGDDGIQTVSFTFYRTGGTEGELEVSYEIAGDVDADDLGVDTEMSGTVSLADGEDTVTLDLLVRGDLTTEESEALRVNITGTSVDGVLVAGARGETTIVTDDFGPEAQDDVFSVREGENPTGNVFDDNGNGPDTDADGDTLTVTRILTQPAFGELVLEENGDFEFFLEGSLPELAQGEVMTVSFVYEVSDGNGGLSTATASFNIQGENDAPDAEDDSDETSADAAVTIDVLANDSDADGDDLEISEINHSGKGSVSIQDGQLVFDPNGDFADLLIGESEEVEFEYTISDGRETSTASVIVTVNGTKEDGENVVTGTVGTGLVTGTDGDDRLVTLGGGLDMLTGLAGADVFDFSEIIGNGEKETQIITDFDAGTDVLDLDGASIELNYSFGGKTYLVVGDDQDLIILNGVSVFENDSLL